MSQHAWRSSRKSGRSARRGLYNDCRLRLLWAHDGGEVEGGPRNASQQGRGNSRDAAEPARTDPNHFSGLGASKAVGRVPPRKLWMPVVPRPVQLRLSPRHPPTSSAFQARAFESAANEMLTAGGAEGSPRPFSVFGLLTTRVPTLPASPVDRFFSRVSPDPTGYGR